jgi:predicted RNA-binding protein
MCLARVYHAGKAGEKPMLEDVVSLKLKEGKLLMKTLFGEEKELEADLGEINFQTSRIFLENLKAPDDTKGASSSEAPAQG